MLKNVWSKIRIFCNVIWTSINPLNDNEVNQSSWCNVDILHDTMPAIYAIWRIFQMTIDGEGNPFIPYEVMLEGI